MNGKRDGSAAIHPLMHSHTKFIKKSYKRTPWSQDTGGTEMAEIDITESSTRQPCLEFQMTNSTVHILSQETSSRSLPWPEKGEQWSRWFTNELWDEGCWGRGMHNSEYLMLLEHLGVLSLENTSAGGVVSKKKFDSLLSLQNLQLLNFTQKIRMGGDRW
jgi:hypothetical protein